VKRDALAQPTQFAFRTGKRRPDPTAFLRPSVFGVRNLLSLLHIAAPVVKRDPLAETTELRVEKRSPAPSTLLRPAGAGHAKAEPGSGID
jgi:hypothetical protein